MPLAFVLNTVQCKLNDCVGIVNKRFADIVPIDRADGIYVCLG